MRLQILGVGLIAACLVISMEPVWTQTGDQRLGGRQSYSVWPMNFDLWCQETQRYSVGRCNERQAEDLREFQEYRSLIERYEMQYLLDQRRNAEAEQRADRNYGAPRDHYNDLLGR